MMELGPFCVERGPQLTGGGEFLRMVRWATKELGWQRGRWFKEVESWCWARSKIHLEGVSRQRSLSEERYMDSTFGSGKSGARKCLISWQIVHNIFWMARSCIGKTSGRTQASMGLLRFRQINFKPLYVEVASNDFYSYRLSLCPCVKAVQPWPHPPMDMSGY